MSWRRLESSSDIRPFMEAAVALHRPLLDRIEPALRPWFFDYWLRLFNQSRAYLLEGDDAALVTVPRRPDLHEYRWQSRTLAVGGSTPIVLPDDVDLSRSFVMPRFDGSVGDVDRTIRDASGRPVQLGYVRALGREPAADASVRLRPGRADELDELMSLVDRGYAEFGEEDDRGREPVRVELRQIFEHDAGWCIVAVDADDRPIAMASYIAMHVPLLGVPAALVADLVVDPACRRRGLARAVQTEAARRLHAAGVTHLLGNIDPGNTGSRRQAESCGRTIWYEAIRFEPA